MACRKCGSDWTTPKGKDCNRCPHCDKQQLFQARKAGRWVEPIVVKQCECCGREFEAIGPKQIKQRVLCGDEECAKQHRKDGFKRRAAGVYVQRQAHGVSKPDRFCKRCGKGPLARDQKGYCGKQCFFEAVNAGEQRFVGRLHDAWAGLVDWAHDWEHRRLHPPKPCLPMPSCLVCSRPTESHSSKFCSRDCMYQWRGDRACCLCGAIKSNAQAHGSVVCRACKKKKAKARRPQHRSNFRRRARKHGVAYVPIKRIDIYERDSWRCQLCHRLCNKTWLVSKRNGRPHPRSPTIDHIVPMSCGGGHVPENVQLACWSCNVAKGARRIGQLRLAIR